MDPALFTNILLGVSTLIGTITPIILLLMKNKQDLALLQATRAAVKVAEVAADVKTASREHSAQLTEIAKVGVDTHTLVNSNMGVQLKLNAVLARRVADITGVTDDRKAAELAELAYQQHVAKQNVVDSGIKQPSGTPAQSVKPVNPYDAITG